MSDRRMVELIVSILIISAASFLIYFRSTPTPPSTQTPTPPVAAQTIKEPAKEVPVEMLTVPVEHLQALSIGIIGESRGDETQGEAFNTVVLQHLLKVLRQHNVQAVFSTGNMVNGRDNLKRPDSWVLEQQLQDFNLLYSSVLGKTPFFPTMGPYEIAAANSSQVFRDAFQLGKGYPFNERNFAYTVSIGNSLFAVIPTNIFNPQYGNVIEAFDPLMISWLDKTLKAAAPYYQFMFVVGHEPAFLTTVIFEDKQTPQRDVFWNVLVENGVLAYFCVHDHQFDRSDRQGVWQIISGGGGAPFNTIGRKSQFFHCLLLTIPQGGKQDPVVEVYDENNDVLEKFELSRDKGLLYQLHISKDP